MRNYRGSAGVDRSIFVQFCTWLVKLLNQDLFNTIIYKVGWTLFDANI